MSRSSLALLFLAALPVAQGEEKPFARIDPYTKSAPDIVQKVGYVSLGPFRFGDDHTTDQVDRTLEGVPLIWIETQHFKIGSNLAEYTIPDDKQEKERLQKDLERLGERLPDVKDRVRKLDPWLRLHLYAQTLEELYAQFLHALDLHETEFPSTPPDPKKPPVPYMGQGRYLGMSSKYAVLLFERKASLARYARAFGGGSETSSFRRHFKGLDGWLYCTAYELLEGPYHNDSALTCDVVAGVVQNLALGLRGSSAPLPLAVSQGLAHWFSRRIDPRFPMFAGSDPAKLRVKQEWNWAPNVRARVERRVFPSTSDMLAWADPDALEWADHMFLWSRLDFLFSREDAAAGAFLRRLKEPYASAPKPEEVAERARSALAELTGGDLAHFDAQWSDWVLANYPRQ